jgi:hypothetical protein
MDLGKMLAEALDACPNKVSWADQNYDKADLNAAAEAFLAKVRQTEMGAETGKGSFSSYVDEMSTWPQRNAGETDGEYRARLMSNPDHTGPVPYYGEVE